MRMKVPYELFIGWRYIRAKRHNHFISFISITSMAGIGLGVAALIVVLSVMNGFQHELRSRILGMTAHLQVSTAGNVLEDWRKIAGRVAAHTEVRATAPYIMAQGMLSFGQVVQGVMVRGVLPEQEARVADIGAHVRAGDFRALQPGAFGIVLGADLSRSLGVGVGDKVVLMAPQGQFTPAGLVPRLKQFQVVGIFQAGMYEYDAGLALIHLEDAARLYRMGSRVSGVRIKLADLYRAPWVGQELMRQLASDGDFDVSDWTRQHANFFRAVQIEKRMMFIILALIVAVAAFNIVSTLVMAVVDKRADIAILRTLGASPRSITCIFMAQGALIGLSGTLLGAVGGVLLALNVETIVPWIEGMLGVQFLPKEVYYISDLPSELQWGDVFAVTAMAFVLSLLATLYPSRRAAATQPAEALRYE